MNKVLYWLAIFLIIYSSVGLAQEEKAKAEDEVLVIEELKDPKNERRSIGWEVTPKRSAESEERDRQEQREEAYREAKKERRDKVRRLRGEQ